MSNYIEDRRPDIIVHLGDHFDLPSLSKHTLAGEREGLRYTRDVESGIRATDLLMTWRKSTKGYNPDCHFLLGNHENRIERTLEEMPNLKGSISTADLDLERHWNVHPFLRPVRIEGVDFSHYFISGCMGRPVSSSAVLLRERQGSAIMGHRPDFQLSIHPRTGKTAVFAGICYTHNEKYLTPQFRSKPHVLMLHEVCQGRFDIMDVSLNFLQRKYS
jgi:hypothetical protein